MFHGLLKAVLFVVFTAVMPVLQADVRVLTHEGSLWAESNYKGFAPELFYLFSRQSSIPSELLVLPMRRAMFEMGHRDNDCYFGGPTIPHPVEMKKTLVRSRPVSIDRIYIFSRSNTSIVTDFSDLNKAPIAIPMGYEHIVDKDQRINMTIASVQNEGAAFKMLMAGRVDYILASDQAFPSALRQQMAYAVDAPVYSQYGYLNCKAGPQTEAFVAEFDQFLMNQTQSGQLIAMYSRYHRTFPNPLKGDVLSVYIAP